MSLNVIWCNQELGCLQFTTDILRSPTGPMAAKRVKVEQRGQGPLAISFDPAAQEVCPLTQACQRGVFQLPEPCPQA